MQLTLYRDLSQALPPVPPVQSEVLIRPCGRGDMDALAESWHLAYEATGYSEGVEAARADMEATFSGEFGELWQAASLIAEADDVVASVVQVVTNPPWDDVLDGPFVIEAFTRPEYRRSGLARALLIESLNVAADAGYDRAGLRVMSDNRPALAMYESLDFTAT